MSVINQMLKDLDERKTAPAESTYEPIMSQSQPSSKLPWVIVAVLSLVILAWLLRDLLPVNILPVAQDSQAIAEPNEDQTYLKVVAADEGGTQAENDITDAEVAQSEISKPTDQTLASTAADEASITDQNTTTTNEQPLVAETTTNDSQAVIEPVFPEENVTTDASSNVVAQKISEPVVETPADPEPRVVKISPQQERRTQAETRYAQYQQTLGGALTDTQYAEVLAIDPEFHRVRIDWLAKLSQQQDSRFEAQSLDAIEQWPAVYQYRQMLARSWVMSEPQQAYQLLMQQPPAITEAPDYHGLIAYSAKQMGDLNLASKQYQLLLKSYPERADWWLALALAEDQLERSASALRAYQQSLRFPGLAANIKAYAEQRIRALQGF